MTAYEMRISDWSSDVCSSDRVQVKRETLRHNATVLVRQLGDQEADITDMVKSITKFAVTVSSPLDIRYLLEKALWLAERGRPGPVWLDLPIAIQSSFIEPARLLRFAPVEEVYGPEYPPPGDHGGMNDIGRGWVGECWGK